MKLKIILLCAMCYTLCAILVGCDPLRKKFTRKPKEKEPQEEVVLYFEEYPQTPYSKDEVYQNYFNFWKSWQDELTFSMQEKLSNKRVLDCLSEAIKNLKEMANLLEPAKQKSLQIHIEDLIQIEGKLSLPYLSDSRRDYLRRKIVRSSAQIQREFSYSKIKDYLR